MGYNATQSTRLIDWYHRCWGVPKILRAHFYRRLCRVAIIIEFICEPVFVIGPITVRMYHEKDRKDIFACDLLFRTGFRQDLGKWRFFPYAIIANLGANPFLGFITEGRMHRKVASKLRVCKPAYRSSLALLPALSPLFLCSFPLEFCPRSRTHVHILHAYTKKQRARLFV